MAKKFKQGDAQNLNAANPCDLSGRANWQLIICSSERPLIYYSIRSLGPRACLTENNSLGRLDWVDSLWVARVASWKGLAEDETD